MRAIAALRETRRYHDERIIGADEITVFFYRVNLVAQLGYRVFQLAFPIGRRRFLFQFNPVQSFFNSGQVGIGTI